MFPASVPAVVLALASAVASTVAIAAQPAAPHGAHALSAPLAAHSLILDGAHASGRLVVVGERGHVLVSSDGGESWRQTGTPTRATLTAVDLLDDGRGLAVGHGGVILRTTDGGLTWILAHATPAEDRPLLGVAFVAPAHAIAVGAYGLALETRDGGETWRPGTLDAGDRHLNHIAATPGGTLFVAGESGGLFRSDDAGESWRRLPAPYAGSFFGTLPLDDTSVYAFGLRGHVFLSDDAGESWRRIHTGVSSLISDGVVRPDGELLFTGTGGSILMGEAGADQLVAHPRPDRLGVTAALPVDDDNVVLLGEFGVERVPVDTIRQRP